MLYIYRWTEGNEQECEIKGDAWSIYRASLMIAHNRDHIKGKIVMNV